jgi:hypothetical protein
LRDFVDEDGLGWQFKLPLLLKQKCLNCGLIISHAETHITCEKCLKDIPKAEKLKLAPFADHRPWHNLRWGHLHDVRCLLHRCSCTKPVLELTDDRDAPDDDIDDDMTLEELIKQHPVDVDLSISGERTLLTEDDVDLPAPSSISHHSEHGDTSMFLPDDPAPETPDLPPFVCAMSNNHDQRLASAFAAKHDVIREATEFSGQLLAAHSDDLCL